MKVKTNQRRGLRQQGISLIEVLVVLIILGLVSTLAMSGGANALLMKQKLQNASVKSVNDSLVNSWLRRTFESAYPIPEHPPTFTHSKIEFVSQNPILSPGSVKQVTWALSVVDQHVVLTYQEGSESIAIKRWLDAEASFKFVYKNERHVIPSLVILEVDYLTPFGRQNDAVLISHLGLKRFPQDFRQMSL